jgi:alkylhydroperoxidase family enzyme
VTFIETVPEDDATAAVEEMYEAVRGSYGHVTNFAAAFSLRPEVLGAWMKLNGAIKANMDMRRYELATLAAARRLRSSYCCLAHGTVLLEQTSPVVTSHGHRPTPSLRARARRSRPSRPASRGARPETRRRAGRTT